MLVIIEGNEGTGKTTLINELSKKLCPITIKYHKKTTDLFMLLNTVAYLNELVILDRSFITDIVYRIWDKDRGQLSLLQIARLCDIPNIRIVMCHNFNGFEKAVARGENVVTCQKDYDRIDQIFEDVVSMIKSFTNIEVYDYDYNYQSVDDVIKFIKGE